MKKRRQGPIIDAAAGTGGDATPLEMKKRGKRGRSGSPPPKKRGRPGRFGDTAPRGECVGDTAPPKKSRSGRITKEKRSKRPRHQAIEYAPVKPKRKK